MTRIRTFKNINYTIISNQSAQDAGLSFGALGLLTYCLSMPEDWDYHPKVIAKTRGCGREKMYGYFNELIANFRCIRINKPQINRPHLPGPIEYEIFDDVEECKKRIAELEKTEKFLETGDNFKKSFRHPKKPNPSTPNPIEPYTTKETKKQSKDLTKESNSEIVHKSEVNDELQPVRSEASPPPDPIPIEPSIPKPAVNSTGSTLFSQKGSTDYSNPEYIELLDLETEYIKHFRPNIVARWITKFGVTQVLKSINYYLKIHGDKGKLDNPEAWMEKALKESFADVNEQSEKNKSFAQKAKSVGKWRSLKINKRYCTELKLGVDVSYNLPKENFETQLKNLYDRYKTNR